MQQFSRPFRALAGTATLLAGGAIAPAARADEIVVGPGPGKIAVEARSTDRPISFAVDPSVQPLTEAIAIGPRSEKAPVAAVADAFGNQGDFVADELILVTDDPGELEGLVERWRGSVVDSVDPRKYGFDELRKRNLVRIDTELASTETLDGDAAKLAPDVGGPQRVSSEEGLRLLAAATGERLGGLDVAVNWVAYPNTIRTRVATENAGTPNAFNWANFCSAGTVPFIASVSCPQNIQVGEAWSELARAGVLPAGTFNLPNPSRPVIAIIDQGFAATDTDRPLVVNSFASGPGSVPCSGGGACPFHGTNMTSAAMGAVDNNFGAAGVAGPVANARLLEFGGNIFTTMGSLIDAAAGRSRVATMSFSGVVPAPFEWTLAGFYAVAEVVRASGTALVASSGNAETDVDATATFVMRFETATHWPCESAGVICVGGLGFNSRSESIGSSFGSPGAGSNFGTRGIRNGTVDIWAPGASVRVGADPLPPSFTSPDAVQLSFGTSVAAPQVAGVIALIAAANPSLNVGAIESVLFGSAQAPSITPAKSKPVERMLAAEPAVAAALGGDRPPELRILTPANGSSHSRGVVHATAFVSDDGSTPTVRWLVDGAPAATGTSVDLDLRALGFGPHRITATAVDSRGWSTPDADGGVTITTTNVAPTVSISMPAPGSVYYVWPGADGWRGDRICLQGSSSDVNNNPARLDDSQVRWEIGTVTRDGHAAGVDATELTPGPHSVSFIGTDDGGLPASATTIEVRQSLLPRSGGFEVVC